MSAHPLGSHVSQMRQVVGAVLGRDPQRRMIVVLVAYLDDSGTGSDAPVVTIAGYAGHVDSWAALEIDAADLFGRYGIDLLHTKDFHRTKQAFSGWSGVRKRAFASELAILVRDHLSFALSVSITKEMFKERKRVDHVAHSRSPYGYCFNVAIDWLLHDGALEPMVKDGGLSIVVESGNPNNGDLERIFHAVRKKYSLENKLKSLSFAGKRDCFAIQIADFLAYYSRRHAHACEKAGQSLSYGHMLDLAMRSVRSRGFVITDLFKNRPSDRKDTPRSIGAIAARSRLRRPG